MLRLAKRCSLRMSRALGLTGLVLHSQWRQNRLLILAWHGTSIDDEHEWDPSLYMPAALLSRRLELIREAGCNVLPLDTALRLLHRGELPPRAVALTVDDGPFDFYSVAFPLVERFAFPVTIYLTTYYANFNRPVYDVMAKYLLWKARGRTVRWPEVLGPEALELSGPGLAWAGVCLRRYPLEQGLGGTEKDALLCQLATRLQVDYASILDRRILHLVSIGEARELAARGVDFQLHTHRHGVSLDQQLFQQDLADNRSWLRHIGAGAPAHFCYPGGVHRDEFFPWLRDWGIASAVTCELGMAERGGNPFLLPRLVDTAALTEDEFVAWLSGIAAFLPRRRYVEEQGQFLEDRRGRRGVAAAAAGL